ncbi:FeoC-like transcriptional regulator [Pantanalinema rosaneae CENA516]|uniref:FeoC-like transcriptional regulator n=1 Tax=Pantanalinema rosaneae TaxID=1620701 RepID=UPI003D6DD925
MILQQLQTYLRTHPPTSLEELTRHFQTDADALRGMLNPLIRKGRVRRVAGKPCSQCHSCAPETLEIYEWVNSGSPPCRID